MDYLYICNAGSDSISKITLKDLCQSNISLNSHEGRVGPHGICAYKSEVIVANNYNNSISRIDILTDNETESFYVGEHCNDIKTYENNAYIVCGESNSLVMFDLNSNKMIREIPCGNSPHSIDINSANELAVVTNMASDSISLIDCKKNDLIKNISTGYYPTKAVINKNYRSIIICESNMGMDANGTISIVSISSGNKLKSIEVGRAPVDMYCDWESNLCFVSNFVDGTISILDLVEAEEIKKIDIGGMPRGIIKNNRYLYIGDYYENLLIKYDIFTEEKNIIPIGKEPSGMTLI